MKKVQTLLTLAVFAALTMFTSCTSYGPAFSHQRVGYMERPFEDKPAAQVYATGAIGSDAVYKPNESNINGGLGVHLGSNRGYTQGVIGVFGNVGQYKADTKKDYSYYNLGIRVHQNVAVHVNPNLELQIVGLGGCFNSESGPYQSLRQNRAIDSTVSFNDFGRYFVTTGLRYRTSKNFLLGFQYAYSTAALFFIPVNVGHCLSFTGNFGRSTLALNFNIPAPQSGSIVKSSLHSTFNIGYTHALTKDGL